MELEDLLKEWNNYNAKLSKMSFIQDESIKKFLLYKARVNFNTLIYNKFFMLVFCGIVLFYLMAHYQLYINDYRYLLPFIGLSLIFCISLVWYGYMVYIIWKINIYKMNIISIVTRTAKLQINEKREILSSLFIALPLLLICLPPITSITFNRLNFYENLSSYIPGMIVGVILSIILGLYLYYKNRRLIKEIGTNLREYETYSHL